MPKFLKQIIAFIILWPVGVLVFGWLTLKMNPENDFLSEFLIVAPAKLSKPFLMLGVDPNDCGPKGDNCPLLEVISQKNSKKKIKQLILYGANVKIKDRMNQNALHYSCNQPELLEFFLKKGLDPNSLAILRRSKKLEWTPLHCAVVSNSPRSVELLLSYGANPKNTILRWDKYTRVTPLHLAKIKSFTKIIKILKSSSSRN